MLGTLDKETAQGIGEFLKQYDPTTLETVDVLSWLYSCLIIHAVCDIDIVGNRLEDWKSKILDQAESLRRDDGGYAKTDEATTGSTYHSFLTMLIYELLGERVPRPGGDPFAQLRDVRDVRPTLRVSGSAVTPQR